MSDWKPTITHHLTKWLRRNKPAIRALLGDFLQAIEIEQFLALGTSQNTFYDSTKEDDLTQSWAAEWGQADHIPLAAFPVIVAQFSSWLITAVAVHGLSHWNVPDLPKSPDLFANEVMRWLDEDCARRAGSSGLWHLLDWLGIRLPCIANQGDAHRFFKHLAEWAGQFFEQWHQQTDTWCDLFQPLHTVLVPKKIRLRMGEFYTPDWLAEHILAELDYPGSDASRLFDPTCGSGVFLTAAVRRLIPHLLAPHNGWKTGGRSTGSQSPQTRACPESVALEVVRCVLKDQIVGMDTNPLAVVAAQANLLLATIHTVWRICPAIRLPLDEVLVHPGPIRCGDLLDSSWETPTANARPMGPGTERQTKPQIQPQFHFLVGNPPWLLWDNLTASMRERLAPLCQELGLFDLSGREARHGGAKRDVGVALVWMATQYLLPGGKMGVVLPATLFRGGNAGRSFRRFTVGPETPLRVLQVEDLSELSVFPGTIRRTVLFFAEKGFPTRYPVPYYIWRKEGGQREMDNGRLHASRTKLVAVPSCPDDTAAPWSITTESARNIWQKVAGPSEYSAYLGANTAGANGVFWLEIIGHECGLAVVRNCAESGRRATPHFQGPLEPDLLYPLLRWKDVIPAGVASTVILLVQDPLTRKAIPEELLKARYPLTYAYLSQFRDILEARAARRKLHRKEPWYSQYNVGHYTMAPHKVVWRRMDWKFRAVLVGPQPRGEVGVRPVVPQETCCFIPVDSVEEGAYLLAILNSRLVREIVQASALPGSRGFASPRILRTLAIPRFDPRVDLHRRLAEIGQKASSTGQVSCDKWLEANNLTDWDRCLAELYGLSPSDYVALCEKSV